MEAIWYALVAALTFLGFVSVLYYIVLRIFNPKNCGKYIIIIPKNAEKHEINSLLYSAHLRSMLFGDLLFDSITVIDNSNDENSSRIVFELAAEYGNMIVSSGKEKNGS